MSFTVEGTYTTTRDAGIEYRYKGSWQFVGANATSIGWNANLFRGDQLIGTQSGSITGLTGVPPIRITMLVEDTLHANIEKRVGMT